MKHTNPVAITEPQGWNRGKKDGESKIQFDSKNRKRRIVCTQVGTKSGLVWNCVLYRSNTPYGRKRHTDSTIAESTEEIPRAIDTLDTRN